MNKIIVIGRTVKDVELRQTQGGTSVANFTLAVKRDFKNSQGEYETDFLECVCWGKKGEVINQHVKKGQQICVSGAMQTRTYQANDGSNRKVHEINVSDFTFIGNQPQETSRQQNGYNQGMQEYNQRVEQRQSNQQFQAPNNDLYQPTYQQAPPSVQQSQQNIQQTLKQSDPFAEFGKNLDNEQQVVQDEGQQQEFDMEDEMFELPF